MNSREHFFVPDRAGRSREAHTLRMPTSRARYRGIARLFGCCCLFLVMCVLVGANLGSGLSYRDFNRIKQEISQLPQDQRARLERNLATYKALSPAEQAQYESLHNYVETQRMQPLVESYIKWLDTLSTFERQELRDSPDASLKLAKVEEILQAKSRQVEHRLPELIAATFSQSDPSSWYLRSLLRQQKDYDFASPYVLSKAQIDTLIDQVLLPQLNAAAQQEAQGLQGLDRIVRVLRLSMETLNEPRESWPSEAAFQLMSQSGIQLVGGPMDSEGRGSDRFSAVDIRKRIAIRRLLVRSLLIYEMRELERAFPVRENDLLGYFAKLDSSKQAALLDSPADYQTEALKWLYLWDMHKGNSLFDHAEFREHVLSKLIPRGYGDRPPMGTRPDGGPGNPEARPPRDGRFGPGREGRPGPDFPERRRPDGPGELPERTDREPPPPGPPPPGPPPAL
ncbi:MAG: hypothetical protein R3C12_02710 [Planctomycetaceae bacterium]|nr:hypothetical protein [Planctomycetaceae bacterium]